MANVMVPIQPDDDWRSWLIRQIAHAESELIRQQDRLDGIRNGRRFKVALVGWPDRVTAQEAWVRAQQEWVEHLRQPDPYLLRFLTREDFGSFEWQQRFWARLREFFPKHAWEPSLERTRPVYAKRRVRAAQRRRWQREHQTGPVNRQAIYQRDGGVCGICGKPVLAGDFHLDHIDPFGPHGPENLRVTHPLYNVLRGRPDLHPHYPESMR